MELPVNRLSCTRCHCFRDITEFPFGKNGLRLATCKICQQKKQQKKQQQDQQHIQQGSMTQDELLTEPQYCSGQLIFI